MVTRSEFAIESARSWYVRQIAEGRQVPTERQMGYIVKAERELDDAEFRFAMIDYLKSIA